MNARYILVAEPRMTGFKLHKEGESRELPFPNIPQAVEYVKSQPDHDGEIIVVNSVGNEISHLHLPEPGEDDEWTEPMEYDRRMLNRQSRRHHRSKSSSHRSRRRRHHEQQIAPETGRIEIHWRRWLAIALIVLVLVLLLLWRGPGPLS